MSKEKLIEIAQINKYHAEQGTMTLVDDVVKIPAENYYCLLYTSPSPRDTEVSRMPSSA